MPPSKVGGRAIDAPGVRALWWEDGSLLALDQRDLPGARTVLRLRRLEPVEEAIRTLAIRGAPSIGVAGAYGMALASLYERLTPREAAARLAATRPTAHDLFVGIDVVRRAWEGGQDPVATAHRYRDAVVEECHAIGLVGSKLILSKSRVLTHCNAGALATVEWGTALAPVRVAARDGKDPFVWVDETRPLLQGARLTAWELGEEGIRHAVIADNAAGHFLHRGDVDLVIVGADRITRSGDFANKIGTYEKAVLARENGVPFYVAAPWSTFDPKLHQGSDIPVEERGEEEVGMWGNVRTVPKGSRCRNPAFDVTPAKYVTAFVTPTGLVTPEKLDRHLRTHRPSSLDIVSAGSSPALPLSPTRPTRRDTGRR